MTSVRIAKRGVWYFMRTVLLIVAFVLLCYGAFLTALRMSNLYILATDSMQRRAECILQDGALLELNEYFTPTFIQQDTILYENAYDQFDVTSYDYRVEVNGISVWPWSQSAKVTVTERMVSMTGKLLPEFVQQDAAEAEQPALPEWENIRYLVRFRINEEGRWFIHQLQVLEKNPEQPIKNTPDPNMSPRPVPTPTPLPTSIPTPGTGG